ncbi:MAG: NAD(P)-binding protein [Oligoflexia bacterium]|nr:NAD(P)-binding protein [Oligoflexia bacterium]
MNQIYDVVIIGAGMSGLAATIRALMFDKNVLLLEKHSIAGGLNSYYSRGSRDFDVGLHALTNYANPKLKHKNVNNNNNSDNSSSDNHSSNISNLRANLRANYNPNAFLKVLRQLRIPFDKMDLQQQRISKIDFAYQGCTLKFSNEMELLISEVKEYFPKEIDNFIKLINFVVSYSDDNLYQPYLSAKEKVSEIIKDPLLLEMIFTPLFLYGSSWENDMDYSQFVIMFRSIFLEGFSKPKGGVRTIINLLLSRIQEECDKNAIYKIEKVLQFNKKVSSLKLKDGKDGKDGEWEITLHSGEIIQSKKVISTIGYVETMGLVEKLEKEKLAKKDSEHSELVGNLSFTETILILDKEIPANYQDTSIIFYNNNSLNKFFYNKPKDNVDSNSSVVCFPNNFGVNSLSSTSSSLLSSSESMIRFSMLANYQLWSKYSREEYIIEKARLLKTSKTLLKKLLPTIDSGDTGQAKIIDHDIFTPRTIHKYTGHLQGSIYGAKLKFKDGRLPTANCHNLFLAGTDQGFLGIVGALLSGVTIANFYINQE